MPSNHYSQERLQQLLDKVIPNVGDTASFRQSVDLEYASKLGLSVYAVNGLEHAPDGIMLHLNNNDTVPLFDHYEQCLDYKPLFDGLLSSEHWSTTDSFLSSQDRKGLPAVKTVDESLYLDYAAGNCTLHEAARQFHSSGWTNFVDEDYTLRHFAELNQKYHKLTDDLKPIPFYLASINDLLDKMGHPDTIRIPDTRSHIRSSRDTLFIPHRFGYQEISLMEIKRFKDGTYRAGNSEEGYYPIAIMDDNNLHTIATALRKAYLNRPENLVKELISQLETGKADVETDLTNERFIVTINDNPHERNYERGFKQFIVDPFIESKDKVFLQDDWKPYSSVVSISPSDFEKIVMHTEEQWGVIREAKNAVVERTTDPSAKSFTPEQADAVDLFLDTRQGSRLENADKLMKASAHALQSRLAPVAWVNATAIEAMDIARDYERYKSEQQSVGHGMRRP